MAGRNWPTPAFRTGKGRRWTDAMGAQPTTIDRSPAAGRVLRSPHMGQSGLGSFPPILRNGAQKRTRTSTPFRAPPPEDGASTNSAIWARGRARPLGGGTAVCQPLVSGGRGRIGRRLGLTPVADRQPSGASLMPGARTAFAHAARHRGRPAPAGTPRWPSRRFGRSRISRRSAVVAVAPA